MKIAIHDYAGHPFQLDLSKQLSKLGYLVTHYYSSSSGGPKAGFDREEENLSIVNINIGQIDKQNFVKRAFQENHYGKVLVNHLKKFNPDIIISANTPLFAQRKLIKWAKKNNIKFIFWLQDIISLAASSILREKIGVLGKSVAFLMKQIEKEILIDSDHVITIADEFNPIIHNWGVSENKITTIPNWAPIEEIPAKEKNNIFAKEKNLTDTFNIIYSGTMGFKHNPDLLYETANLLENEDDIRFIVISEGAGVEQIKRRQKEKFLRNLIILPFQDWKIFPDVLASADLLLILLEKNAGIFSVPSKVWSGFCAARASLLVVPDYNLASKIVKRINAGVVVDKYEPQVIAENILRLKSNQKLLKEMGNNARKYAEEYFIIEKIAEQFISIIENVS